MNPNWRDILVKPSTSMVQKPVTYNGSNISILILSFNRSGKTIDLLKSFAKHNRGFQGEIVVLDQDSDLNEFKELEKFAAAFELSIKLVRGNENLGVAAGRNKLSTLATKDWLLFLDNDLEVLKSITQALYMATRKTNSPIVSFALEDASGDRIMRGGRFDLSIDQQSELILVMNPIKSHEAGEPSYIIDSDVILGGAVAIWAKTFDFLGKYDEGFFVGFEDWDFSLIAYLAGFRIVSIQEICLRHAQKESQSVADELYASTRFSMEIIEDSARHFEAKWGINVMTDGVKSWVNSQRQLMQLGVSHEDPSIQKSSYSHVDGSNPRIIVVVDTREWAFERIVTNWKRILPKYQFEILYWDEISMWFEASSIAPEKRVEILVDALKEYDLIHFMWVGSLVSTSNEVLTKNRDKISTAVYDHYSIQDPDILRILGHLNERFFVSSQKLFDAITPFAKPLSILPDGVDLDFFPFSQRALGNKDEEIIIGWVGNSSFGGDAKHDLKGFWKKFLPALDMLRDSGVKFKIALADRANGELSFDEMPNFYKQIDVLICTSKFEGTPNPVLEAISSGVPVISSDVGIVRESVTTSNLPFVLDKNFQPSELARAIKLLATSPNVYAQISQESQQIRTQLGWDGRKSQIAQFFDQCIGVGKKESRFCLLPFSTPSIEVDGSIRLCSSSSIFPFRSETNMGSLDEKTTLLDVWRADKYRNVRGGLLGVSELAPYCNNCDYKPRAKAWLLQYHLALESFWRDGSKTNQDVLQKYAPKYEEYSSFMLSQGLHPVPKPVLGRMRFGKQVESLETFIDGKIFPLNVDFNTLNRCNVGCIMCPPSIRIEERGVPRDKLFVLTKELFEHYTSGVNLNSCHFVGEYAEPLMNKEIVELVRTAKNRGSFTAITTNAMLLSRELSESLLEAGLDMVSVSLHGASSEISQRVMRKSNLEKIKANLMEFKEVRESMKARVLTYINFVGMSVNIHEFGGVVQLAKDIGFANVNLFALIDGDKDVDKALSLNDKEGLLREHVKPALKLAKELGVQVNVSSPYRELLEQ